MIAIEYVYESGSELSQGSRGSVETILVRTEFFGASENESSIGVSDSDNLRVLSKYRKEAYI